MMFLTNLWDVFLELSPWLLLGALVSAALHFFVPPGFVNKQLSGPMGVVKAVFLGVPLPLCSCGVIPAAVGLKRDGASDGSAVGFLVATPQTGVDSVLVSASFLGWPFALWKVGAALATGLIGGWVTDAVSSESTSDAQAHADGARRTIRQAVDHGIDVVRSIWGWLLFGVVASAMLTTWLPADSFVLLTAQGAMLAFVAVLLISLPLYVCATASVPIAAALVASGMPTGAALVFLMAGPATNIATLGAVYRTFGVRIVGVYLSTIVLGSIGFGLLYEQVFGALSATASGAHQHATWWGTASAVLLVGLLAWFALEDARAHFATWQAGRSTATELIVDVKGMTCNGCANRLQRVLLATDGVEAATVSFNDGTAIVRGAVAAEQVREAVRGAGFDAA